MHDNAMQQQSEAHYEDFHWPVKQVKKSCWGCIGCAAVDPLMSMRDLLPALFTDAKDCGPSN